jgi:hypothetical protein
MKKTEVENLVQLCKKICCCFVKKSHDTVLSETQIWRLKYCTVHGWVISKILHRKTGNNRAGGRLQKYIKLYSV